MCHIIHENTMHNKKLCPKQGFTLVEIMIVGVVIALLCAIAIPAFRNVRNISQTKGIHNNLRQLASGADRYFLEHGVVDVQVAALLGPDAYVKAFEPVAEEQYPVGISEGVDIVAINTPTGEDIIREF